jgi:hypothetical protein
MYTTSIERFNLLEEAILKDINTDHGANRARQMGLDLYATQEVVKNLEGKLERCSCNKKITSNRK